MRAIQCPGRMLGSPLHQLPWSRVARWGSRGRTGGEVTNGKAKPFSRIEPAGAAGEGQDMALEKGWPVVLLEHPGSDARAVKALLDGSRTLPGAEVLPERLADLKVELIV